MAKITDDWTPGDWRQEIARERMKLPRVDHNGYPITTDPPVWDMAGPGGKPRLVPPPATDPPADPPPPEAA